MFTIVKTLIFALVMVPVVMLLMLGIIYGIGELFNRFSPSDQKST